MLVIVLVSQYFVEKCVFLYRPVPLRSRQSRCYIVIVVCRITANKFDYSAEETRDSNRFHYIQDPFRQNRLTSRSIGTRSMGYRYTKAQMNPRAVTLSRMLYTQ